MVQFCDKCNNLFTYYNNDIGKLYLKCDICGNESKISKKCIYMSTSKSNQQDYEIKKNMIYDNTLARSLKIICVNPKCKKGEIIIFNYNPKKLNTGYMCTLCYTYWKN